MSKLIVILFSILIFVGCTDSQTFEIPENFRGIENLTVHQIEVNSLKKIQITRDVSFGEKRTDLMGRLGAFEIDSTGRLFITDLSQTLIHVFTPDGSYQNSFGKEGSGPGEFRLPSSLKIIANRLFVYDSMQQRMNIFSLESLELIQSYNLNLRNLQSSFKEIEELSVRFLSMIRENTYLVGFGPTIFADPENPLYNIDDERIEYYYLIDSSGGLLSKNIFRLRGIELFSTFYRGNYHISSFPFTRRSLMAISEEGYFYLIWSEDLLIRVYDPAGEYLRAMYIPVKKRELSRSDALSASKTLDWFQRREELYQHMIQTSDLPEFWPVMNSLLVDDENRLWVSTIVEDFDIYEWWVLEESGELITRFEWPRDESIEVVKNGYMYTRETEEETGLQQIVRYRIEIEETE